MFTFLERATSLQLNSSTKNIKTTPSFQVESNNISKNSLFWIMQQFNAYDDYTELWDAHNNLYLNIIADQAESDSTDVSSCKDTTRFKAAMFSWKCISASDSDILTFNTSSSIYLREGWLSLSWTSEPWRLNDKYSEWKVMICWGRNIPFPLLA